MRITTQLGIIASGTIIVIVVLIPMLVLSFIDFRDAKNDDYLADSIKSNFFERSSFRDQYFLHHEDRIVDEWDKSKQIADNLLRQADGLIHCQADRDNLVQLRKSIEDTATVFHRIVSNYKLLESRRNNRDVYLELDKRLSSQLLLKAGFVRDSAIALQDSSKKRVEQTYQRLIITIGFFALALAISIILLSISLIRIINKRLIPLHEGAKKVASGDLAYQIPSAGTDEFAELAHSFNSMTAKLNAEICAHIDVEKLLKLNEVELANAQSLAHIGNWHVVFGIDEPHDIWTVSKELRKIWGESEEDSITSKHAFATMPPEDQLTTQRIWESAKQGLGPAEWEHRIIVNGNIRWIHVIAKFIFDNEGKPIEASGTNQDVTERKFVETKIIELNRDFVSFLENTSDFIYFKDNSSRIRFCSQTLAKITGHASWRDMIGKHDFEIFPKDTAQIYYEEELPIFRDGVPLLNKEDPYFDESGNTRWVSTNKWPLLNKDGVVVGLFGISRDITERKNYEWQIVLLNLALDHIKEAAYLMNEDGKFLYVNEEATHILGYSRDELIGGMSVTDIDAHATAETYAQHWQLIKTGGTLIREAYHHTKDGRTFPIELSANYFEYDGKGYNLALVRDITERKQMEEKMMHLAQYDVLTDLPNRTLFSDRLQQALVAAKRDKAHLALMFIDLDKFKPVNDEYGHLVGDQLLKEVAKRMQACVRESDTVARLGGDEFVVLLPIIDAEQDAIRVAEKIRHSLNQAFELNGRKLHISSSTGIVVYPEHGLDETELTKNADVAMYHVKESGRNAVMLFGVDMLSKK